jgi:lysophospholipase L1-like esterase
VLMTPPRWADDAAPDGQGENPNVRLEPYVAACREVARLWRLPLVDHYAHWTEARQRGTDLRTWTTDGCHPNPAGHEVLAITMLAGVREAIGPRLRFRRSLSTAQPVRVVCLGDSVTGIYYHTGSRRAYGDILGIALRRIAAGPEVTVINAGLSGDTTDGGLARLDRDVLIHEPDLVTVMFGLNDMTRIPLEEYRRNLREIVARCRARGSEVVLATPNNVTDTEQRPSATLVDYCDVVRAVGREENLPVCDVYREFEAVRAGDPLAWRLLFSDEIHPNMDGHKRVSAALARTIAGQRVDLADVRPAQPPLRQVVAALKAGRPVRLLAMPPLDGWIDGLLKEVFPTAEVTIETWPVGSRSLAEIEQDAKQRVRSLKPDGVLIAIPRSVTTAAAALPVGSERGEPAAFEAWIGSYAWTMNWSLNYNVPTWDVVVVHPDVWEPLAAPGVHDALIRRLAAAKDLPLVDRPAGDAAEPIELLRRGLNLDHD